MISISQNQSTNQSKSNSFPKLTLETLEKSRPPRGNGAPSRTRSHYDRILILLRERGNAGVLSSELYDAPHLYGRSPRNRISEMRQDGHLIKTTQAGASVVRYVLLHENASPIQRPADTWRERLRDLSQKSYGRPQTQPEWGLTP